jgi:hypothetical protein
MKKISVGAAELITTTSPIFRGQTIEIHQMTTAAGNILQMFYNSENDLVVVDLIASNDLGGTELLRQTLNENKLLVHCVDKGQSRPEPGESIHIPV